MTVPSLLVHVQLQSPSNVGDAGSSGLRNKASDIERVLRNRVMESPLSSS